MENHEPDFSFLASSIESNCIPSTTLHDGQRKVTTVNGPNPGPPSAFSFTDVISRWQCGQEAVICIEVPFAAEPLWCIEFPSRQHITSVISTPSPLTENPKTR